MSTACPLPNNKNSRRSGGICTSGLFPGRSLPFPDHKMNVKWVSFIERHGIANNPGNTAHKMNEKAPWFIEWIIAPA